MNQTSTEVEFGVSEIELAGLHTLPQLRLSLLPRIAEAPVSLWNVANGRRLEIGQNRLVIGLD